MGFKFRGERDAAIDVLRGSAIVLMVVWHGVMWFSETRNCHIQACEGIAGMAWWFTVYAGSLLSVALFYLSAGMTLALNLERRKPRELVRRVAVIIVAGYSFSVFLGGWRNVLDAQVLQSIGVGILLMLALSRVRYGAGLLYAVSVLLAFGRGTRDPVLIPEYRDTAAVVDFLINGLRALFFEGNFPVFAWGGFIALGYALRKNSGLMWSTWGRTGVGAVLILASLRLTISKYPLSPGYLFFFSGLCLIATAALDRIPEKLRYWCASAFPGQALVLMSRYSLEIYLAHFVAGTLAVLVFPAFKTPIWMALAGGGTMVVAIAIALFLLRTVQFRRRTGNNSCQA